jgi:hypothetical protein
MQKIDAQEIFDYVFIVTSLKLVSQIYLTCGYTLKPRLPCVIVSNHSLQRNSDYI